MSPAWATTTLEGSRLSGADTSPATRRRTPRTMAHGAQSASSLVRQASSSRLVAVTSPLRNNEAPAARSTMTVALGCNCRNDTGLFVEMRPEKADATDDDFEPPSATSTIDLA